MSRFFIRPMVILILLGLSSSHLSAALVVYTDRQAWETALFQRYPNAHFHEENFMGWPVGTLGSGCHNPNGFPLEICIPGTAGFNMIDNAQTNDPFGDALNPNGSNYYLGDVNVSASEPPQFQIFELEFSTPAFGADWVVDGSLIMHVRQNTIDFNTHLPSGSGFLGFVGDQASFPRYRFSGSAVFGMDDVITGNVPEPSSLTAAAIAIFILGFRPRSQRSRQALDMVRWRVPFN